MDHAQVVAHLVGDHVDRLVVLALVDGAGVVWVTHAGDPGEADDAVLAGPDVVEVEAGEEESVVPVVGGVPVSGQDGARVLCFLPPEKFISYLTFRVISNC